MKRVAIIQSCYVPWIGFFDMIARCDEYIIFDQVQFVKRHWHNRNKIKTPKGAEWMTIPVISKSRSEQPIEDVEISEPWAERHWRSLAINYQRAPFFADEKDKVRGWFDAVDGMKRLTEVNAFLLKALVAHLRLNVRVASDHDYKADGRSSERLLSLCQAAGATHYLSGPSAKNYLDEAMFAEAGVVVEWMAYGPYEAYPQLHGEFDIAVSILDQIFNRGPALLESPSIRSGLAA